jgi:hypothetical protein
VVQGTPIIFDYRLGHRGLGNRLAGAAAQSRAVLYFTYTNKPNWGDAENFSRRRYLPLPSPLLHPALEVSREGRRAAREGPPR